VSGSGGTTGRPSRGEARPAAAATPVVEARAAATVVILRPGEGGLEVLLTRRPSTMRFGPDLMVFPGGRLEAGETAREAAIRETFEEVSIRLEPGELVPMTRWVTPTNLPIRFDARFFGVVVPPDTRARPDPDEVVDARWLRATSALEAMATGELAMWQPTVVSLQQLEGVVDAAGLRSTFAGSAGSDPPGPSPRASEDRLGAGIDARPFVTGWAGGIEGRVGVTWVIGAGEWVVVDPADPTGQTAAAIQRAAADARASLAGVVVTSLEPERHAGVELFATGLGLPVAGPAGAAALAPYALVELDDGEPLPFGDARVRAVREAAPGIASGRGGSTGAADGGGRRWAERAGRLRLMAAEDATGGRDGPARQGGG